MPKLQRTVVTHLPLGNPVITLSSSIDRWETVKETVQ